MKIKLIYKAINFPIYFPNFTKIENSLQELNELLWLWNKTFLKLVNYGGVLHILYCMRLTGIWTSLSFNSGYWRSFQIFRIFLISSIQTFCITFQYAEGNTDYCNLSRMIINEEEINLLDIELSNIYFPNFTKLRIYYKSWLNVLMEKKLS